MRRVSFAATQFGCGAKSKLNVAKAKSIVREAAARGANVILLPELFETTYFCQEQDASSFSLARPLENHPVLAEMSELAATLGVVLPVSFFERAGHSHFNTLAIIDADGAQLGIYRKSHIPDGPGYQEKFYFTPVSPGVK